MRTIYKQLKVEVGNRAIAVAELYKENMAIIDLKESLQIEEDVPLLEVDPNQVSVSHKNGNSQKILKIKRDVLLKDVKSRVEEGGHPAYRQVLESTEKIRDIVQTLEAGKTVEEKKLAALIRELHLSPNVSKNYRRFYEWFVGNDYFEEIDVSYSDLYSRAGERVYMPYLEIEGRKVHIINEQVGLYEELTGLGKIPTGPVQAAEEKRKVAGTGKEGIQRD